MISVENVLVVADHFVVREWTVAKRLDTPVCVEYAFMYVALLEQPPQQLCGQKQTLKSATAAATSVGVADLQQ